MPPTCTICNHKKREQIDQALINGDSLRDIARQYHTTKDSLARHKKAHLPEALLKARDAEQVCHGDDLMAKIQSYMERTERIATTLESAKGQKDYKTAIMALREVRGFLELLLKAKGQLPDGGVSVQVVVGQMDELTLIFMEALRSELQPAECQRVVAYLEKRRRALDNDAQCSRPA